MKRIRKLVMCASVLVMLAVSPVLTIHARAKVTQAPKYSLKNVMDAERFTGKWEKKKKKKYFREAAGQIVKSRWIKADDGIYYVNAKSCQVCGWISYRNRLYYMDKNGKLHTGWLRTGRKTYFMGEKTGKMLTGLQKIKGSTYCFSQKTGEMRTGWLTADGNRYYFESSGKMAVSRWVKKYGKYYYVDDSGKKLKSGWLSVGENTYYLDDKGARVTGSAEINGVTYYFDSNGVYCPSGAGGTIDSSKPMVALTFDDGPGKYTDRLLNCLENNNARATFFMVGSNVPYYQSAVRRMTALGCELGNHSYSHPQYTHLSTSQIQSEVSRTSENIRNACGKYPTVARLPYGDGASNSTVLSAVGLPSIYWSIDTRDWEYTGSSWHTVDAVLNHVRSGDIVLMHDIHYATIVAAETIIPSLIERGYQLVTVSELARYKGKTSLQSGRTYWNFY